MLHILLLILKIIGILIGAILGIVVLLFCVAVFVPVRYKGDGECDGNLEDLRASLHISWLFQIVSFDMEYLNRQLHWRARVAFKRLTPELPEPFDDPIEESVKKRIEGEKADLEPVEYKAIDQQQKRQTIPRIDLDQAEESKEAKQSVKKNKSKKLYKKIKNLFKKIKYTFKKFCGTITILMEKKDKIVDMLTDATHKRAFRRVKREGIRMLKSIKPKRFHVNLCFGFDDPCRTGQVLAGYCMLYPFIGNNACITPDFEHQVLKGTIYIKGRIRAFYFLVFCWNLFWDRNVRQTYKDVRAFKL